MKIFITRAKNGYVSSWSNSMQNVRFEIYSLPALPFIVPAVSLHRFVVTGTSRVVKSRSSNSTSIVLGGTIFPKLLKSVLITSSEL